LHAFTVPPSARHRDAGPGRPRSLGQHGLRRPEQFRRGQRHRAGMPRLRDRDRRHPQHRCHLHLRLEPLRRSEDPRGPERSPRIRRSSCATRARRIPTAAWAAYTATPAGPLAPTDGHSCTNPSRERRLRALRRGLLRHAHGAALQLAGRRRRGQPGARAAGRRGHTHVDLQPAGRGRWQHRATGRSRGRDPGARDRGAAEQGVRRAGLDEGHQDHHAQPRSGRARGADLGRPGRRRRGRMAEPGARRGRERMDPGAEPRRWRRRRRGARPRRDGRRQRGRHAPLRVLPLRR
jgi:hypothetical protein